MSNLRSPQGRLALGVAMAALAVAGLMLPVGAWAQERTVHVVQQGENLFRLSLRYGTTVEAIRVANDLSDDHSIYVGQRLVIPTSGEAPATTASAATTGGAYIVQRGDTLIGIALRYGVSVWELMHANGLTGPHLIYAGQRLFIPGAGGSVPEPVLATSDTHVVQAGDTLTQIARRYHTTAFALAQRNGLVDPSSIHVGQVLTVPRLGSEQPGASPGQKLILIDLTEQHLYAFNGEELVYSFVCSSGRAPYYTRSGDFEVQSKILNAYGATWDIWMPHWLGIYWAGSTENGIHALPIMSNGETLWEGYLGSPVSYGCIVLATADAANLYGWADIGTRVSIRQ
jgi:LysM repeat protein